ncbi:MAG: HIRAN domain-containing protein [Eubacteriales bacterium]|nr:HIRAN domain-containing protein [Eubacteriales bacterium]
MSEKIANKESDTKLLPDAPATFEWVVSLAMTGRAPCKTFADQLKQGDALILKRDPQNPHDSRAIAVLNESGQTTGYLYALEAGLLYLLLDHYPPLADGSHVESIIPPGHSRRSPIVRAKLRLELASATPLFVLIAMLELKGESFPRRFDFNANPWLVPLRDLHRAYIRELDDFHMPQSIIDFWQTAFVFG